MLKFISLILLLVVSLGKVNAQTFKEQMLQPVIEHYVEKLKQDTSLSDANPLVHQPIIIIDTFHLLVDECDSMIKGREYIIYNHIPHNYIDLQNCYSLYTITVENEMLKLTFYQRKEIPAFGMCYFYYKMHGRTVEFLNEKCYESRGW